MKWGICIAFGCVLGLAAACGSGNDPGPQELAGSWGVALSPCEAFSRSLRAVYAKLQQCESDEDCVYVNGFYDVIPRDATDRFVTTSDCREKSPFLVAANGARLAGELPALTIEREVQHEACAEQSGPACDSPGGFRSELPPACIDRVCTARLAHPG